MALPEIRTTIHHVAYIQTPFNASRNVQLEPIGDSGTRSKARTDSEPLRTKAEKEERRNVRYRDL